MANYAQKPEICKISFSKFGVTLSIKFTIEPADSSKHTAMMSNSTNQDRETSIAIPEGTSEDLLYLQETNQEYITLSEALKEEN